MRTITPSLGRSVVTLCALVAASVLPAQQRVDRRYALSPAGSVRLTVVGPRSVIRVVGWQRDSVAITGTIAEGDRFDGGVLATGAAGKFFVESRGEGGVPARLELRVPARARVWVKAGSAEVDARDMAGALDLNIVAGSIRVAGRPRELNAEAMDGDITVSEPVPWLRAKTAGGAITLRGGGEDVAASSVSGRISVDEGSFTRGRFETVTGDIDFSGGVDRQGMLTFDSHSGAVVLRVPPSLPASYDVTTITGEISNELTPARALLAAERRARELGFTTGGGGAEIVIRTFKGPITLRRQ
ncbi:MAG TPA: hypothetical protein VFS05_01740 [Gemmatimonadaceae bacterium]|nr:hypothetical protein [Gemmatimonadaceae bacterium]